MATQFYQQFKTGKRVFIIGEAGVNHNGSLAMAKRLVKAAAHAGCDAVKFQTFKTECVISQRAPKAKYQQQTTGTTESQFQMVKKLELDIEAHRSIINECRKQKILFLSTPFDIPSADMLDELGVPAFKIPSGEITNIPLLQHVARKGKPLILSTGMSNIAEIRHALKVINKQGNKNVVLLQCTTAYPAPMNEVNLRVMDTLKQTFKLPVGYSDHTLGTIASLAAAARGAVLIEKHLTLDCALPGPDHRASLEPIAMKQMVQDIRLIELTLGVSEKKPVKSEIENIVIARKSVVANRALVKGQKITHEDIAIKRPGSGIEPKDVSKVIGRRLKHSKAIDEVIVWGDLV